MRRDPRWWMVALPLLVGACGDSDTSRFSRAVELRGVYDLETACAHSDDPGIGWVGARDDDVSIVLSDPAIAISGTLAFDRSVDLEGRTMNSDVIGFVRATARVERMDEIVRITGAVDSDTPPCAFALERSIDADARPASGRYRLRFAGATGDCDCPTTIDLSITFDRGGTGTIAGALLERGGDGATIATLPSPNVHLAPSSRFHLGAEYDDGGEGICANAIGSGGNCVILIDGTLPLGSDGTGVARFEVLSGLRMSLAAGELEIERIGTEH